MKLPIPLGLHVRKARNTEDSPGISISLRFANFLSSLRHSCQMTCYTVDIVVYHIKALVYLFFLIVLYCIAQ